MSFNVNPKVIKKILAKYDSYIFISRNRALSFALMIFFCIFLVESYVQRFLIFIMGIYRYLNETLAFFLPFPF